MSTAASSAATAASAADGATDAKEKQIPGRLPGRPNVVLGGDYGADVDISRWVVLYGPYIDANLKEKDGRKIGKVKCVADPKMVEIFDCAQMLGFQAALEMDKAYSRDAWRVGRVRVNLFDSQHKPRVDGIPNRRTLYARIAALIPEHRARSEKAKKPSGGGQKGGQHNSGGGKAQPKKKKKGKR